MKIFHNKSLFLLLITALLTAQWASAHIHLAEHHEHDGSHHQHIAEGHAYHASGHHTDNIDGSSIAEEYNVVELEHECTSSNGSKLGDLSAASLLASYQEVFSTKFFKIKPSESDAQQSFWISYSTVRLRAPPRSIS